MIRLSIRKWLPVVIVAVLAVSCLTLLPAHSWADSVTEACQGAGLQVTGGKCGGGSAENLNNVLRAIVNILSAIVGVAAVIMIMIGGFRYITSGGDANAVSGAKKTVIYALVGLVLVALAQVIVHFVLTAAAPK